MNTVYLDNAATSFPKPQGVSDRMKYYLDCVGANVNRSVYTAAQEAGLVTLTLRQRLARQGYTLLGDVLSREAGRYRPRVFVLLYLAGFALTFGGTLWLSARSGELALPLLQGTAPGVCLQAAGIYGFCVSAFSHKDRWPVAETISKASSCVYLVHLLL